MPSIQDDRGYNQGYKPSKSLDVRNQRRCGFIAGSLGAGAGKKALEIGCGTGELAAMFAGKTGAQVFGTDICGPFIEKAAATHKYPNLHFKMLDFNDAQASSDIPSFGQFDMVFGNGILHHLYYNLDQSLLSVFSLLKPGGKIVFLEPNFFNPYCLLIFNIGIFRKMAKLEPSEMTFTAGYIKRKLMAAGFTGITAEYRDFLVPGVPDFMIKPSILIGGVMEKIPVLNLLAQSIYICASKPAEGNLKRI